MLLAASQRGAFIPSSARQQRVSHDGSSARSRSHAANNGCACCSFGGFRLSPKPPTCWDEGSSSRCSRRQREAQSCQPISPAVQQYSLTPTASRKSTETIKSTRLTIRRIRRFQSKKYPVEKGRFRLAESDCIRNCLRRSISFAISLYTVLERVSVNGGAYSGTTVLAASFWMEFCARRKHVFCKRCAQREAKCKTQDNPFVYKLAPTFLSLK